MRIYPDGGSPKVWALGALLLALLAPVIGIVLMFGLAGMFKNESIILRYESIIFMAALGPGSLLAALAAWHAARKHNAQRSESQRRFSPSVVGVLVGAATLAWSFAGFFGFAAMFAHGRRFRVRGKEHLAQTEDGPGWTEEVESGSVEGLSLRDRALLAEGWEQNARAEHASIAAFSRLSLQLMALGAPSRLLELAQQAALDEVRHAKHAFSQASLYAGRRIQPSPFPKALLPKSGHVMVAPLATESFIDGCIGEAVAAKNCSSSVCAMMGRLLPVEELALRSAVEEESRNTLTSILNVPVLNPRRSSETLPA